MLDRLNAALQRRLAKLGAAKHVESSTLAAEGKADELRKRGNAFIAAENLAAAEVCFREALLLKPNGPELSVCLGYVLKEQGRLPESRAALRRAISQSSGLPDEYEAHYLYGQVCEQDGELAQAEQGYAEALEQNPAFVLGCGDLCRVLELQGKGQTVRAVLERSVAACPQIVQFRLWLADACEAELDFPGVVEHLQAAVAQGHKNARTYLTLGAGLCRVGSIADAHRFMALAENLDPGVAAEVRYHLGYYHIRSGELQAGLAHLERCISLNPDFSPAHSLVLLTLSHTDDEKRLIYRDAALRFGRHVRRQIDLSGVPAFSPVPRVIDRPGERLRVGFVSGDLYTHPVAFFLQGLLKHLDKSRFELIAYCNNAFDDQVTASLKERFDHWHEVRSLINQTAAELIHSHGIDILIDLGGHTGESRLGIFARRPAPVQVTWLGYFASTGLAEIDYIIGDPKSNPDNSTEWFSEKLFRLPNMRLCMSVPTVASEIRIDPAPPSAGRGYVTFGSFQQTSKITGPVLAVWSKVLKAVPNSRLHVQTKGLDTTPVRERMAADMLEAGIDPLRVTMTGSQSLEAYLTSHNEIDILLDTFPYPGGTTTAFGLWMGVPTVTLAGNTMLSRQGGAMLSSVGLDDWIAESESGYLDICVRMVAAPATLNSLRASLRQRALESPLFDSARFAADFGAALLAMHAQATPKTEDNKRGALNEAPFDLGEDRIA